MKKNILLALSVFLLYFPGFSFAQLATSTKTTDKEFVKDISKFLGSQCDISSLKSKKEVYGFNLRIKIKKVAGIVTVSEILSTDSIGYKIFPNYMGLKKMDYKGLLTKTDKTTLVIPILILNNPIDERNSNEMLGNQSKSSLTDLITSLLYPNLLQENLTLFPLFTFSRADVQ